MIVDYGEWVRRRSESAPFAEWTDEVVPGEVELLPHANYSPRYAWMYAYEKSLKRRIEKTLGRQLGAHDRRLFGPDGAFSEGLSNAFLHGHKRDSGLAIRVSCSIQPRELAFVIRDGGGGFDVESAVQALRRGGTYYHMAGNGLRCLAESPEVAAAHSEGGRALYLRVRLASPETP